MVLSRHSRPPGGPPLSLILFDVDGTLVDSQDLIVRTMEAAFAEAGRQAPRRQDVLRLVGRSLPLMMAELAGPDAPVEPLVDAYRRHFQDLVTGEDVAGTLYPGAAEAIARLAAAPGVRLGIATGKSRRGVARILDQLDWHGLFATIQTADDAPSKPHPGMILQALAETGAAAGSTCMVGDSIFDMQMALAAGVAAIGVSWGYHPPADLLGAGAGRILASFAELTG